MEMERVVCAVPGASPGTHSLSLSGRRRRVQGRGELDVASVLGTHRADWLGATVRAGDRHGDQVVRFFRDTRPDQASVLEQDNAAIPERGELARRGCDLRYRHGLVRVGRREDRLRGAALAEDRPAPCEPVRLEAVVVSRHDPVEGAPDPRHLGLWGAVTHVFGYACAVASTFQTQTNVSEPGMVWMVNWTPSVCPLLPLNWFVLSWMLKKPEPWMLSVSVARFPSSQTPTKAVSSSGVTVSLGRISLGWDWIPKMPGWLLLPSVGCGRLATCCGVAHGTLFHPSYWAEEGRMVSV
jgi:hypothetical protein